uniref:SFRICE_017280 n=1 Tax=Spodoptera frugiperda TaxID=7108 RepID=A0A2H1V495_SPOFR
MEKAKRLGLWDGQSEFNFTRCFSSGGDEQRQQEGARLLKDGCSSSAFDVRDMMNVLRHKDSRICRSCDDTFPTQGSQVSSLSDKMKSVHWFTATPDPSLSLFKPFVFTKNAQASPLIVSPDEPLREHHLYKLHMGRISASDNDDIAKAIQKLEEEHIADIEKYANDNPTGQTDKLDNVLKDCVETEVNLYA